MTAHLSSLQVRQAFKSLGFSENEIKIISFLFRQKKSTAREISQTTAISFSSVQYGISNLTSREIVRCLPKKEDVFEICSEKDLFKWIEEQKENNKNVYENAKKDIHSFLLALQGSSWKPEVMYYEGKEGIINIYEDMIETGKDIYCWTDIQKIETLLGKYMKEFIKNRVKNKIVTYAILPINDMNIKYAKKNEEKREVKLTKNLPIDGEIRIYGDNVAVITFEKTKPIGFVFRGSIITNLFKSIFESYWKKS